MVAALGDSSDSLGESLDSVRDSMDSVKNLATLSMVFPPLLDPFLTDLPTLFSACAP